MKNILSIGFAILIAAVFASSCKKKGENVVIGNATKPVLSVSTPTFTDTLYLSADSAANNAADFSWTAANWGVNTAVRYAVEMIVKGDDWENATVTPMDQAKTISYTQEELNNAVIAMNVPMGTTATISARVKSFIDGTNQVVYSNVVDKVVSTYSTNIIYPKMYFPGDYQGWSPDNANCPYIESKTNNGKFVGIFEHTKADGTASSGEFKMTPQPNWSYDFGDNGSTLTDPNSGSGVIGPLSAGTNGTNFKLANGTYLINVDTIGLTWSYELANWGLIGDATPGGWASDQNMRYNTATKMYEITIDLIVGSVKFRKNDDWGTNIGWATGSDGDPIPAFDTPYIGGQGGKNIGITAAGNYTFSLDPATKTFSCHKN